MHEGAPPRVPAAQPLPLPPSPTPVPAAQSPGAPSFDPAPPLSHPPALPPSETAVYSSNLSWGYPHISALLTPCVIARPEPRKKVAQLCPTLYDSMACSLPGSSVQGILQARMLEWVAFPFSRRTSPPGNQTQVSCIAGRFFTTEPPGKHVLL